MHKLKKILLAWKPGHIITEVHFTVRDSKKSPIHQASRSVVIMYPGIGKSRSDIFST